MDNVITGATGHAKDLTGKVCLVTGGSRGIGKAIVTAMGDCGADVAFTYQHSKDQAEALAKAVADKGVRCKAFQANVASPEEMQAVVKQVIAEFGHIAILVNNAGINRDRTFLKMTKPMWDEVMRVNLDGVFCTTQLVAQDMVDSGGWGRIINISSLVGQTGNFGQSNYAATKGAIIAFTESLARELARKGITVNAVAPGFIETDMVSGMPEAALNQVKAMTPMGRLGKPEEIADAVVFLASPRASYVTGQVLGVNGGMYM